MQRDIDKVIATVKTRFPDVTVEQLKVTHPGADDDGVWCFSLPNTKNDIQVESPTGNCPFLVESDLSDDRAECASSEATANLVVELFAGIAKT